MRSTLCLYADSTSCRTVHRATAVPIRGAYSRVILLSRASYASQATTACFRAISFFTRSFSGIHIQIAPTYVSTAIRRGISKLVIFFAASWSFSGKQLDHKAPGGLQRVVSNIPMAPLSTIVYMSVRNYNKTFSMSFSTGDVINACSAPTWIRCIIKFRLHPDDRRYQLILCSLSGAPITCELNTVTYGLACAPFLAQVS